METTGTAGNNRKGVRSDCLVTIELAQAGGIEIELKSKVEKLYSDHILGLCKEEMAFFEIENARVRIEDSGALPFVLAARIEAAVKKCIDTQKEYLLEMIPDNLYQTAKDRYRRSRLYLPGNTPSFMINAGIHRSDGIILDLEDAVAPGKKREARLLVRNALRQVNFYGAERMVRINQVPMGLEDLHYVIPHNVNVILVPKCESADQIKKVEQETAKISREKGIESPVYIMPIIESALGVIKAFEIAISSPNVVALAIGLEDYTADLGTQRTREGRETFFARSQIVNAARAARIQPVDSVFSDVSDMEALKENVLESKSLGFDGMGCIHPRQIEVIHKYYAPDDLEITRAKNIVNAFHEAADKGLGVVSLGSKMIDPPVVKRAQRTIDLAIKAGKCSVDWRDKYGN